MNNVTMKDISKIIKDFEKLPYKGYVRKRPKKEPTDSYFYLAKQLANCTMRADAFNLNVYPVRKEMTVMEQIPISHVCDLDESELKEILAKKPYCKSVLKT